MLKSCIMLTVALLIISTFAFALQVSDIQQSVQENNTQITQLKAETTAKLTEINAKIDKFATKDDVQKLLEAHLQITNEIMDKYRQTLTISFVLIGLCILGLGCGVYFYFKSKRRV